MNRAVLPFALLISLAGAGRAQTVALPDNNATSQLTRIVEGARDNGLPVDPIIERVQYGINVAHADPARIVASARAVAARLEVARFALAPANDNEIIAGANALGSGADTASLRVIRKASGKSPAAAVPLSVLTQLLSSKVPLEKATEIVKSFVQRGATDRQLASFANDVTSDVTSGAAALAALDTRARFLSGVLAPAGSQAAAALGPTFTGPPKKP